MKIVSHECAGRTKIAQRNIRRPLQYGIDVGGEPGGFLDREHDCQHRVTIGLRQEHRHIREQMRPAHNMGRVKIRNSSNRLHRRCQSVAVERDAEAAAIQLVCKFSRASDGVARRAAGGLARNRGDAVSQVARPPVR